MSRGRCLLRRSRNDRSEITSRHEFKAFLGIPIPMFRQPILMPVMPPIPPMSFHVGYKNAMAMLQVAAQQLHERHTPVLAPTTVDCNPDRSAMSESFNVIQDSSHDPCRLHVALDRHPSYRIQSRRSLRRPIAISLGSFTVVAGCAQISQIDINVSTSHLLPVHPVGHDLYFFLHILTLIDMCKLRTSKV